MRQSSLFARAPIVVLLQFMTLFLNAQNGLSVQTNLIQPGDSVVKERVKYTSYSQKGENVIWDVSSLETEGDYWIKYDTVDMKLFGYDDKNIYKYQLDNNRLLLSGYESPLVAMEYHQPILSLPLPLQYGQNVSADYIGEGYYCGTHYERSFGTMNIAAEGTGTIILSDNDTLPNTLMVYILNTAAIRLNRDSCSNDSNNLKQVITETYQWYSRGFRYPVFETVTSSTFDNGSHVATQQSAFRCSPAMQGVLVDSINEQIRNYDLMVINNKDDSLFHDKTHEALLNNKDNKSGFHYNYHLNGKQILITYDLENEANIHVMIVDVFGRTTRDVSQKSYSGTNQSITIDCNDLRQGQYILYINVNGAIYTSKIPVK